MAVQLAIYSPADRLQPHRFKADESYEASRYFKSTSYVSRLCNDARADICSFVQVGAPGMSPVACYLDIEGIIQLAKEQNVDAIHPGCEAHPKFRHSVPICTQEKAIENL